MSHEFNYNCVECGQPATAKGSRSTRCKSCQRIRDNERAAARMATKKREDPEWRKIDSARSRHMMDLLRSDVALTPTTPRRAAAQKRRQLIAERASCTGQKPFRKGRIF
jgi:tRNA(Ile2) C34 agmatinyltransferase TiaS